jgi:monoamine oxidase
MKKVKGSLRQSVVERQDSGMKDHLELDVAIVGGGTSGLYTAWRLTTGQKKGAPIPRVQVFEMSDRIAGRLDSVYLPGMEIAGELGGMRYMDAQEIVFSLITKVFPKELPTIPFPMGDPATHFFYARTQRSRANAWSEAQKKGEKFKTNYFLPDELLGWEADQLFNKIIYDVMMGDPWFVEHYGSKVSNPSMYNYNFELTGRDWDDIKPQLVYTFNGPYQGMKVNDLGFWNVIKDQAGEEAYEYLSVAGGYYSNTPNWDAAEAFENMIGDFTNTGTDSSYKTIDGGYDLQAYAVANAYLAQADAKIWTCNQLITFRKQPAGSTHRYALDFYNIRSRKAWTVYANAIVLAMPRRSLELLDQDNFFFDPTQNPKLQQNIASVLIEPSFKLLMAFEYPWWKEDFGATSGESITDLPMRQCYYFGTDPNDSHSMFLSSYNDMRTVTFWGPLEPGRGHELFKPRATKLASQEELDDYQDVQATKMMVDEVMEEVRELHGIKAIPQPYVTWFKDWSKDPFGGGYHGWNAAVSVKHVMPYMRQPVASEAVHICGEAYSDQQGWVEGAYCVAERMLQEHFGLDWPTWLDPKYYLGW